MLIRIDTRSRISSKLIRLADSVKAQKNMASEEPRSLSIDRKISGKNPFHVLLRPVLVLVLVVVMVVMSLSVLVLEAVAVFVGEKVFVMLAPPMLMMLVLLIKPEVLPPESNKAVPNDVKLCG
jgi:hypothetical protein